jgi:glycerol kinase
MRETTALGAAIAAGLAIGVWRNFAELRDINRAGGAVFEPQITREEGTAKFAEWEKAVQMSRGWIETKNKTETSNGISPEAKTNETPTPLAENCNVSSLKLSSTQSRSLLISDIVSEACANTTIKLKAQTAKRNLEFAPSKAPIISVSSDLDDADEEDLFLDLRKVEILQELKRLRKLKIGYFK